MRGAGDGNGEEARGAAWTVPVVANGRLYLRFAQRLLCFDTAETGR